MPVPTAISERSDLHAISQNVKANPSVDRTKDAACRGVLAKPVCAILTSAVQKLRTLAAYRDVCGRYLVG